MLKVTQTHNTYIISGNNKVRCALPLTHLNMSILSLSLSCCLHFFPGFFPNRHSLIKLCASEILSQRLLLRHQTQTFSLISTCLGEKLDSHFSQLLWQVGQQLPNYPGSLFGMLLSVSRGYISMLLNLRVAIELSLANDMLLEVTICHFQVEI